MSELKDHLTITPPRFYTGGTVGEAFSSPGHKCTYCNGKGCFTNEIGREEYETKLCPVCNGSKVLRAMVAIKWVPDTEKI